MKTITATQDTYIKKSTAQSASLPESDKLKICKGKRYYVQKVIKEVNNHYFIELSHSAGLWYFFTPHFRLETEIQNAVEKKDVGLKTNKQGLEIIKEYEGVSLTAYLCPSNVATIGRGSTFYPDGKPVKLGDRLNNMAEVDSLFETTIKHFEQEVDKVVTNKKLNSNQYSALISFVYNIGINNLRRSTVLKRINEGNLEAVRTEFPRWNKGNGGKVLEGLKRRRKSEVELFFS